jgi:hypothetical protein
MSADESLGRAEGLLAQVEALRQEIDRLAAEGDAEHATEVLTRLAELAKQVEDELQKAKRASEADARA